jgi:hypothetical protein
MFFGGIDPKSLEIGDSAESVKQGIINSISEYWQEIINCDVSEWSYGGDLSDIADYENTRIIKTYADIILSALSNPKMIDYLSKQITKERIINDLASADDAGGDSWASSYLVGARSKRSAQLIGQSECVNKGINNFLNYINTLVANSKSVLSQSNNPASVAGSTPSSGQKGDTTEASKGVASSEDVNYIRKMSDILIQTGFLKEPQDKWTTTFDSAFRRYIDKATELEQKIDPNITPTHLSDGSERWVDVARNLKFDPTVIGAYNAVSAWAYLFSQSSGGNEAAGTENPENVLAEIVSAMYSNKLVGTPGIDLVNEVRRCKIIVDAVGGPTNSGFRNAATLILIEASKLGINLNSNLPKTIGVPIDKAFAKRRLELFQDIQKCINKIISEVFGPLAPPSDEKAVAGVRNWIKSQNIQIKTSLSKQELVKLTSARKREILSKVAAEATVKEVSEWRRIKI